MPPRFAYWTILIDNAPTAFRARDAAELLPTVTQLKRTNANVVLKWFARGRLWESQEQERADFQRHKWRPSRPPHAPSGVDRPERRPRDWRPGGDHKDPRARFSKTQRREEKRRAEQRWKPKPPRTGKPWRQHKPEDRPWRSKPKGKHPPQKKPDKPEDE